MANNHLILLLLLAFMCSCQPEQKDHETSTVPKNVILLIGDGTGLSQISSAFYYKKTKPNYARFPFIGLIRTSSSKEDITDSAAGATAFAAGVKTYNRAIGVADDTTLVDNLVEIVSPRIKTGLISTSAIQHATPASFYAHVKHRKQYEDIAADMIDSDVDFFAGGGKQFFNRRTDGKNLLMDLMAKGFGVDTMALGGIANISKHTKMAYVLADEHMLPVSKGRGDFLPKAAELGIQFLTMQNDNFFLMVEGSQIDFAGHQNDADYLISELIDFDNAIGKCLDFAEKDGNTLVIVTADHETGGFTLASTVRQKEDGKTYKDYTTINPAFSTKGHSAALIPVFAYGPGAEDFAGVYENTEIFHKIMEATKWNQEN